MNRAGSQPAITQASDALSSAMRQLYDASGAARYGISTADFAAMLSQVLEKYATRAASDCDAAGAGSEAFYKSLKVEDLVLARACANGNETAWNEFMSRFRAPLYDMARAITKEDAAGRELADSIYADLFGTRIRDGQRISKLSSYMGRGSLQGWLRTILAQEWIDRFRKTTRLTSLEEQEEQGRQFVATASEPAASPVDAKLVTATDQALAAISPEDRYILAAYFLNGFTLAQIARTLSVHESTISRRVEKITRDLRSAIVGNLVKTGMSRAQAEEALDIDVRDLTINVKQRLSTGGGDARPGADRSP